MEVLPSFVPSPTLDDTAEPVADRPFFVFVGRLEKLKGAQDLLRVFRTYRDADLLVVGTGSYRAELERRARDLPHVKFVGAVHPTKLADYYRQAIAVLVPSLCYEVFPLIPAEAMSYGTPVISRRIGALTGVIEESGGGISFETLEECQAAMTQLQADPVLRAKLGSRGRETAQANWTTDVHLERYTGIVRGLLDQRRVA